MYVHIKAANARPIFKYINDRPLLSKIAKNLSDQWPFDKYMLDSCYHHLEDVVNLLLEVSIYGLDDENRKFVYHDNIDSFINEFFEQNRQLIAEQAGKFERTTHQKFPFSDNVTITDIINFTDQVKRELVINTIEDACNDLYQFLSVDAC